MQLFVLLLHFGDTEGMWFICCQYISYSVVDLENPFRGMGSNTMWPKYYIYNSFIISQLGLFEIYIKIAFVLKTTELVWGGI